MKLKKGMTLIEIIIALAILGIISISFIGGMSNNLLMMFRTKAITEDLFHTQKNVESKMEELREGLWRTGKSYEIGEIVIFENNKYEVLINHTSDIFLNDYSTSGYLGNEVPIPTNEIFEVDNIFGVTGLKVSGLLIGYSEGRTNINTLVSHGKIEFKMPILEKVESEFIGGDDDKTTYMKVGLSAKGYTTLDNSTLDVFLKNVYGWYASKPGFNIAFPSDVNEIEWGGYYPRFPDDYELISSATNDILTNLDNYKGKFLVMTATPASKVGKIGKMIPTDPIFLKGFDINTFDLAKITHVDYSQYLGEFKMIGEPETREEVYRIDGNDYILENKIIFKLGESSSIKVIKDYIYELIYELNLEADMDIFVAGFHNNDELKVEHLRIEDLDLVGEIDLNLMSLEETKLNIGKEGSSIAEIIIVKDITEDQKDYINNYLKTRYLLD